MKINPDILKKYASGKCTEADKHLVEKWLSNNSWDSIGESSEVNEDIGSTIWDKITAEGAETRKINWHKICAAAAVIFILGFSILYFPHPILDNHTFTNRSLKIVSSLRKITTMFS